MSSYFKKNTILLRTKFATQDSSNYKLSTYAE
jgi:hypothetical protein